MRNPYLKKVLLPLIFFVIISSEGVDARMKDSKISLPKSIGVWTRADSPKIIDSKNIFDYMDGAGELYLSYRFKYLEVYEYKASGHDDILVELYYMQSSDDAFGLLSQDWDGKIMDIDLFHKSGWTPFVLCRSLYGKGLLRFWSNDVYVRIMAFKETPASKKAVMSIGKAIVAKLVETPEPKLLTGLPVNFDKEWKYRKDRICYLRSHLVLNSFYFIGQKNILHLDHTTEAVIATYENSSIKKSIKRIQFLFIKYETSEKAQIALDNFCKVYLLEHKGELKTTSMNEISDFIKIEDGWLGYKLKNNSVAFVFECPDNELTRRIINQIKF